MKAIIMGCGRVGAGLAVLLQNDGYQVTVIDLDPFSFRRLPAEFAGEALIGNGMDEDTLIRAGVEDTQVFVAATQGDNRNVMGAQVARAVFQVPVVVCRIYDPIREEMYRNLGIRTFCPTTNGAAALFGLVKEG